jgi:hypothetical protein
LGGRLGGPIGVNAAMGTILGSKASRLLLQADVQFFPGNGLRSDGGPIRPYAGVGGRVGFGSGADHGGIRAPFGFLYEVSGSPLDFFVEAAPVLDIWSGPAAVFVIDGALGMRYVIARTRTVNP